MAIFAGNILKVFPIRIEKKNFEKKNCNSAAVDNFSNCACACLRFGPMDSFDCLLFNVQCSEPPCFDVIFDAEDIWPHQC